MNRLSGSYYTATLPWFGLTGPGRVVGFFRYIGPVLLCLGGRMLCVFEGGAQVVEAGVQVSRSVRLVQPEDLLASAAAVSRGR